MAASAARLRLSQAMGACGSQRNLSCGSMAGAAHWTRAARPLRPCLWF